MATTKLHNDTVLGAVTVVASVFGAIESQTLTQGAGVVPFVIFVVSGIVGCIIAVRGQMSLRTQPDPEPFFRNSKKFLSLAIAMLAYFIGVSYLGYFTGSLVMIPVVAVFFGKAGWRSTAFGTAGFLIFIYVVFVLLFNRPLPEEIFMRMIE